METALKILAVDNEPSVTLSMRYLFDGPRYALTTVNDGDAALSSSGSILIPSMSSLSIRRCRT